MLNIMKTKTWPTSDLSPKRRKRFSRTIKTSHPRNPLDTVNKASLRFNKEKKGIKIHCTKIMSHADWTSRNFNPFTRGLGIFGLFWISSAIILVTNSFLQIHTGIQTRHSNIPNTDNSFNRMLQCVLAM